MIGVTQAARACAVRHSRTPPLSAGTLHTPIECVIDIPAAAGDVLTHMNACTRAPRTHAYTHSRTHTRTHARRTHAHTRQPRQQSHYLSNEPRYDVRYADGNSECLPISLLRSGSNTWASFGRATCVGLPVKVRCVRTTASAASATEHGGGGLLQPVLPGDPNVDDGDEVLFAPAQIARFVSVPVVLCDVRLASQYQSVRAGRLCGQPST